MGRQIPVAPPIEADYRKRPKSTDRRGPLQRDATVRRATGVLIVIENLPAPFDRRVWQEARTLRDAGYRVSIICPKGKGYEAAHEVIENIAIWRHPLPTEASGPVGYLAEYGAALFFELILAIRIAFTRGFKVIQACNPPDLIFIPALVFKLFGVKFIFDHHDLCPELWEAKTGRRGIFHRALMLFERLTFVAADVSIATNESYRKVAIERGRMNPSKVFVVRSAPERARWTAGAGDLAWKRGRQRLVGYVGVMGEQEGLDLLLQAAKIIIHERGRGDVFFLLIGDGTERSKLEALSRDMGLADNVEFTGRIGDAELLSALSTADVLVNPDRPSELNDKSTMNKIVEYMAVGRPIVQFDTIEGRYSAGDSSLYPAGGDVTAFADAILAVIDDPAKAQAMGAAGRARFETTLCWEHQRGQLLAAYAAALGAT